MAGGLMQLVAYGAQGRVPYWNPRDYFLEGVLQTPY